MRPSSQRGGRQYGRAGYGLRLLSVAEFGSHDRSQFNSPRICARLRFASTVAGGEFHSPRVNFASWLTGFDGNDGRRFLDRQGFERLGEPAVEFFRIDLKRARPALARQEGRFRPLALVRQQKFPQAPAACRAGPFRKPWSARAPTPRRAVPRTSARSLSVSATRCCDFEKNERCRGSGRALRSAAAGPQILAVRKPSKKNRSVGRPATDEGCEYG